MAYLGRVIAIGRTRKLGAPFVAYAVSGRSPPSRERKPIFRGNTISIVPIAEPTREQREQAALFLYDAIIFQETSPFVVVSNGSQTRLIYGSLVRKSPQSRGNYLPQVIEEKLNELGPEPDKYNTPRIVGVIDECKPSPPSYSVGIITAPVKATVGVRHDISGGVTIAMSTYSGKSDEPMSPTFSTAWDATDSVELRSATAQTLADSLYDWIDPQFVVCTAAALWREKHDKWEIAIRNKSNHGDKFRERPLTTHG